jgi:chemotaxis signal transduction protein
VPNGALTTETSAERLRQEFDASFGLVLPDTVEATEDVLLIGAGDGSYVISLADVAEIRAVPTVTALPGSPPVLHGVAGFRGALVSVFDLASLLGASKSVAPRWLLLAAQDPGIGLAFDYFEGHQRVPQACVTDPFGGPEPLSALVDGVLRHVLRLSTVLTLIDGPRQTETKERPQ